MMASHTSPENEEKDLSLALKLSQIPLDESDKQVAPLHSEASECADRVPHPATPRDDDKDDAAPASSAEWRSSNEQGDDDDAKQAVELLLRLSLLPADPNEQRECWANIFGPIRRGISLLEDDERRALYEEMTPKALIVGQMGVWSLDHYEESGRLDLLETGINAFRFSLEFLPENHPMKPETLNRLGMCFGKRFERLGNVADLDLEDAVAAFRQAVYLTPDGDADMLARLSNLGKSLKMRFERFGDFADLDERIVAMQQTVHLAPDDHPYKLLDLTNLGISFRKRFGHLGNRVDLDKAVTAYQQAVLLTPDGDADKLTRLSDFGESLQMRFERFGDFADLDEIITTMQQAIHLAPDDHPDKPLHLIILGISFRKRFGRLGNRFDLDEAVTVNQQAVLLTPDGHRDKPSHLHHLGRSLSERFGRVGDVVDIHEAITAQRQAVRLTSEGHPNKPRHLNSLGTSLLRRFERLNDHADLDEAITMARQAVRLAPDGHPDAPEALKNLGVFLQCRFQRLGDLVELNEAIATQQRALSCVSDEDADQHEHLNNLGNSFFLRFQHLGGVADLNEAIAVMQRAARLTPETDPRKPAFLHNFGNSLLCRFEHLGELVDLDEAITTMQLAVRLAPNDHPDRPGHLSGLGGTFVRRFEHLRDPADIHNAVAALQATYLLPDGRHEKAACLDRLAFSLQRQFVVLGDPIGLDEAVRAERHAVRITMDDHVAKSLYLGHLGNILRARFDHSGRQADIDEAIILQRQAIRLTPDGHTDLPKHLNNLGLAFRSRFKCLADLVDLDEAITLKQQAVQLTADDHPDKPGLLTNLGNCFLLRLARQPDNATLAQAISIFSQSAMSPSGPPIVRFNAARQWASLCFSSHSQETLDACSTLINLLPRVVWLGMTVEQRYKDISDIGDSIADAVTAAIYFGKPNLALEWMEQGRSIVWGQMLRLRTPLDELRERHPHEANELGRISRALDSAGITPLDRLEPPTHRIPESMEEVAQARRRLAEEYDHVLARIRNLPGFSEFLKPTKSTSLCNAAISGPVVVVNAHRKRCDALILVPHSPEVSHVRLPALQFSEVQGMQHQWAQSMRGAGINQRHYAPGSEAGTTLVDILDRCWSDMVEPILGYLKLLGKPTSGQMPHVTWCLTGPLTFLPIHAAGLYRAKPQPKIFDYVVSSHTPTLTSLLSAKHHFREPSQTTQLLAISQPATPLQDPLPGTVNEVHVVQSIQRDAGRLGVTWLNDREATVAAVLGHMKECQWVHLACHGIQMPVNPTESAFLLFDEPLTLREIVKQSFSHAELAFLSACQTAKGHSELPEEAIHLAAGMLMAGYGNVVATMWSIRDDDGPIVAEEFYKYLIEADGDSSKAAYALHHAVARLRDLRGEDKFERWAPFIHFGFCSPSHPLRE